MTGLRKLKGKMAGVRFVEKITGAMRFTSQAEVVSLLPKFHSLEKRFSAEKSMMQSAWGAFGHEVFIPEYLRPRAGASSICIIYGPQKGFCGSMTEVLANTAIKHTTLNDKIWVAGRDVVLRLRGKKRKENLTFDYCDERVNTMYALLIKELKESPSECVFVIYPKFKNLLTWEVGIDYITPLTLQCESEKKNITCGEDLGDFWAGMVVRYVWKVLEAARMHAQVSEHAARMAAMDKASKNAQDLCESLRLQWQRCRQSLVTSELLEVTAGAVALEDM